MIKAASFPAITHVMKRYEISLAGNLTIQMRLMASTGHVWMHAYASLKQMAMSTQANSLFGYDCHYLGIF